MGHRKGGKTAEWLGDAAESPNPRILVFPKDSSIPWCAPRFFSSYFFFRARVFTYSQARAHTVLHGERLRPGMHDTRQGSRIVAFNRGANQIHLEPLKRKKHKTTGVLERGSRVEVFTRAPKRVARPLHRFGGTEKKACMYWCLISIVRQCCSDL